MKGTAHIDTRRGVYWYEIELTPEDIEADRYDRIADRLEQELKLWLDAAEDLQNDPEGTT